MSHKVFISSTKKDLAQHREAVKAALLKNDYQPVEMDDFGSRDVDPVTGCLRLVAESQVFVGIYAWRYGYVPPGKTISITAEELEQARRLGKPLFFFLVEESYSWPAASDLPPESQESRELLMALKDSVRSERMVATFTTPETLALEVVSALGRWERAAVPVAARGQLVKLLDKVERFWVKCVLEPSIPRTGLLMRDREERLDEVAQPWAPPAWAERGEAKLLPPRAPLDLFVGCGRRLLILGEGGYGKTTDLLQLAGGLAALARDDPEQPVPVVLKLGSWGRTARHLGGWMAGEIHRTHNLDLALVRSWIDGDRLLPLLDGLDEVELGCRDACARAINQFLAQHPACGLAVSCRSDVNDELGERLDLCDAYALWPLSAAALDRYLAAGGPEAEPLRAALAQPDWRKLAGNPLLLLMMERVLRAAGVAALGAAGALPASMAPAGGAGSRQVLAAYVKVMLAPPDRPLRFAAARTRRGLAWLACQMSAHRLALFKISDLQPSWLGSAARVWLYAVVSRALGGALLMFPIAVLRSAALLVPAGLVAGAVAGWLDGRRLLAPTVAAAPPADAAFTAASAPTATPAGSTAAPTADHAAGPAATPEPLAAGSPAARALAIGAAAMLSFNLFAALSKLVAGNLSWRLNLPDGLRYGFFFGALFGVVFGLRQGRLERRERGDTEVAAGLTRTRWSWSKSRRGAVWPLPLVVLWLLIEHLRVTFSRFAGNAGIWLLVAGVASALGGLVGGLLGDLQEETASPRRRHPGLRAALAVTARAGGSAMLGTAAALGLLVLLLRLVAGHRFTAADWRTPLFVAPVLGLWVAIALRGLDIVQHHTLRMLLWLDGIFPLRWVRFLDYTVDCNLMHRVGPGYEFIHPWLLAELAGGSPVGDAAADPAEQA